MTPKQITQLKKLDTFNKQPQFAIFKELNLLNDSIKSLIEATKVSIEATNASKTETVTVDNLSDAIVDLSPLQANFEALKGSVEAVTKAIQAIPEDKEMDMSGVEKLLGQIASKEMDMSHMMAMTKILDDILFAVQTTASHSNEKDEVLAPDLKKIQEILNLLNENVVAIEIPGFDYDKLARIIKDNLTIKVSGGGGVNPAPQINAKLDTLIAKIPALGQTTMSASLPVTMASDQTHITTINTVHKRVHEGRLFSGSCINTALANNGVLEMLIQSGAQATHMHFWVDVSGDATVNFYEGTTFSAAGTAVPMANHNRGSVNTFVGTITHTPTLTADGTQINGTDFAPGGVKGSGGGGSSQSFTEEFILATSTNYLIRLTNISGGTGKFDIHLAAYQPNL